MRVVAELVGLIGAGSVVYGCHLIWTPSAFIVGGAFGIFSAAAMMRRTVK